MILSPVKRIVFLSSYNVKTLQFPFQQCIKYLLTLIYFMLTLIIT